MGDGGVFRIRLKQFWKCPGTVREHDKNSRPSETTSFRGGVVMSLNKHDLDSYRRLKRHRAQKIDLLIVLLFSLVAIFITLERPAPGPGSQAFHKAVTKAQVPAKSEPSVIARANH